MIDELKRRVDALEAQMKELRQGERGNYWSLAAPRSYGVAWTATGTQPAIGDGTLLGRYIRIGKLCAYRIYLAAGSTTTFGTGAWSFSLPFLAGASGLYNPAALLAYDLNLTTAYDHHGYVNANSQVITLFVNAAGAIYQLTSGAPFAWANGDTLRIEGTYETE